MAKRMNRGRSSKPSARSPRSRGWQVRYCAVAALPGMRFRARPGTDAPFSCTRHETTEMMTISGGSRGDAGAPKQTAERVFPPTPIVPTMSVARWARPAPSASRARASAFLPPALVPRLPALVRYFTVRPAANPRTIADRRQPVPTGAGPHASVTGPPDPGPARSARPVCNRRQATELIPS
jgi:hypothetical protein